MITFSSVVTRVKHVSLLSGCAQRQMASWISSFTPRAPSQTSCLSFSTEHLKLKYSDISVLKTNKCLSAIGIQMINARFFRPSISKQRNNFYTSSIRSIISSRFRLKTCLRKSLGSEHTALRHIVPRQGMSPNITCSARSSTWLQGCVPGLIFGLLLYYSTSEPVHAEVLHAKKNQDQDCDSSSVSHSHGKQVYTDYSIIGIPGDGRCMFRSVAHGACVRAGKPAPNEATQRELADELRSSVANEFVKRREETEWFIEGDFDTYVSQIRKPHVWGGEPELLMASHVLQTPITVYMHDKDSGGLISIAEYGQEYGKENPIKVLYHGFGHYDALQIHENNGARSRL